MKSTILLATALFLATAPSPDSKSVSEMSAGFLIADDSRGLMAADSVMSNKTTPARSYEQVARSSSGEPARRASEETEPEIAPARK